VILYELADDFCHVSTILSADFLRVTACNASHVLAIIEVSICLSVCLSVCHTLDPIKTVQARITKSSLWSATRTLVFHDKVLCS